jgi:hypothetical protein
MTPYIPALQGGASRPFSVQITTWEVSVVLTFLKLSEVAV